MHLHRSGAEKGKSNGENVGTTSQPDRIQLTRGPVRTTQLSKMESRLLRIEALLPVLTEKRKPVEPRSATARNDIDVNEGSEALRRELGTLGQRIDGIDGKIDSIIYLLTSGAEARLPGVNLGTESGTGSTPRSHHEHPHHVREGLRHDSHDAHDHHHTHTHEQHHHEHPHARLQHRPNMGPEELALEKGQSLLTDYKGNTVHYLGRSSNHFVSIEAESLIQSRLRRSERESSVLSVRSNTGSSGTIRAGTSSGGNINDNTGASPSDSEIKEEEVEVDEVDDEARLLSGMARDMNMRADPGTRDVALIGKYGHHINAGEGLSEFDTYKLGGEDGFYIPSPETELFLLERERLRIPLYSSYRVLTSNVYRH